MKPLRFLIGNSTLSLLAGSEMWTKTLALELKKMGHSVDCYALELGIISTQLEDEGIRCYESVVASGIQPFSFRLEESRDYNYDVIIASHNQIVDHLRRQFPSKPIISVIHGVMHEMRNTETGEKARAPEHPATEAGVNQFVAVSEEVQEILKVKYNIDAIVIRNFFDTEKFNAKREASAGSPKNFFINTNYSESSDPEVDVIRQVAKHYGAKLAAAGQNFTMNPDIMTAIEDADVVVGMGRSVLEGICAGRLGIVQGRWGTGGVVYPGSFKEIREYNFSGRNSGGNFWLKHQFIEAIDAYYNKKNIEWGRNYVLAEHNVTVAAEQFVQISRGLLGQGIVTVDDVPVKPFRRARDVAAQAQS